MKGEVVNPEFRAKVDAHLDSLIERFYEEVPFGRHQVEGATLDMEYYRRHCMETIRRIRLKRTIDALVIHWFTKRDPKQAKAWAQYTDEEMLHDQFFAGDLERLGVSREAIYGGEPFLATKLLQGYFYWGLEHEATPLAPLVSAYFLEYTTRKTQPVWLDHLEAILGKEATKGARAHVNYDVQEDHTWFVWNVIMSLVQTPEDEGRVLRHINNLYALFCAYFIEAYESTVETRLGGRPKGAAVHAVKVASLAGAAPSPVTA